MMKPKSDLAFSDENIFRAFIYANDSGTPYKYSNIIAVQSHADRLILWNQQRKKNIITSMVGNTLQIVA